MVSSVSAHSYSHQGHCLVHYSKLRNDFRGLKFFHCGMCSKQYSFASHKKVHDHRFKSNVMHILLKRVVAFLDAQPFLNDHIIRNAISVLHPEICFDVPHDTPSPSTCTPCFSKANASLWTWCFEWTLCIVWPVVAQHLDVSLWVSFFTYWPHTTRSLILHLNGLRLDLMVLILQPETHLGTSGGVHCVANVHTGSLAPRATMQFASRSVITPSSRERVGFAMRDTAEKMCRSHLPLRCSFQFQELTFSRVGKASSYIAIRSSAFSWWRPD